MINSVNNTSFRSRSAEIRFADDIARKVNQAYPRISSSLVGDLSHIKRFQFFYKKLCYRLNMFRDIMDAQVATERNSISCLKSMLDLIKRFKMGNCFESACLSSIALKANGIKEYQPATVHSKFDDNLDHAVVLVPNNGKPYIVDSWLGFADYVPKAFERYRKEFHRHFDFYMFGTDEIILKQANIKELYHLKNVNINLLRQTFPELVKKRTNK